MSSNEHLRLPAELLLAIFSILPVEDISRCKQLSHAIYDLLSSSAEIQYKIELYCAYQREMDMPTNTPTIESLKTLQSITDGWANLRFSRHLVLGYPLASSYVYEVSGGRLVLGSDLNHIASHINGTSVLSVHDFPRPIPNDASGSVKTDAVCRRDINLEFPIADFAMDVQQNLLVLVRRTPTQGIKLYMRTLDSNSPHPDAPEEPIEMLNQSWVTIHISRNVMACLFVEQVSNGTDIVVMWNWRTGYMLGQIAGIKQKSFVLISDSSFVVANLDQDTLDVYDIDQVAQKLVLVQRLLLPSVRGEDGGAVWTYDDALLRSHPPPVPASGYATSSSTLRPHTELPFTTDESDGIVSCTFSCYAVGSSFTLVVHRSALRHAYNEDVEPRSTFRAGRQIRERLIPWSDWGPKNTRWISGSTSSRWICFVHGFRLAVLEPKHGELDGVTPDILSDSDDEEESALQKPLVLMTNHLERLELDAPSTDSSYMTSEDRTPSINDDGPGYHYLRVFDFNPRAVRRAITEGKTPVDPKATCESRARIGQTLVTGSSLFQRYVTSLPYLETTVRLRALELEGKREHIEGVMLNAESIMIMMSHSSWANGVEVLTV